MEFRILGPLEVVTGGQALDLGGAKQRALLAVLLLHANRVVSTDRLIDALWEDDPPESAHKALQVYVSGVRKLLGKERVQTKPPCYVLRVHEGEFDLDRFRALQAEGRPAEALSWVTSNATTVSDRTNSRAMANARYFSPTSGRSPDRCTSCHSVST